jgi:hypothetical protein
MLHVVFPLALVRQHAVASSLPQVECAAHFFTAPRQPLFCSVAFACCTAQLT